MKLFLSCGLIGLIFATCASGTERACNPADPAVHASSGHLHLADGAATRRDRHGPDSAGLRRNIACAVGAR